MNNIGVRSWKNTTKSMFLLDTLFSTEQNRTEQTVPTIEHTVYRVHCHQFNAIPSVWRASFFMSFIHFNSIAADTAADENGQEQKMKQTDAEKKKKFSSTIHSRFFFSSSKK